MPVKCLNNKILKTATSVFRRLMCLNALLFTCSPWICEGLNMRKFARTLRTAGLEDCAGWWGSSETELTLQSPVHWPHNWITPVLLIFAAWSSGQSAEGQVHVCLQAAGIWEGKGGSSQSWDGKSDNHANPSRCSQGREKAKAGGWCPASSEWTDHVT